MRTDDTTATKAYRSTARPADLSGRFVPGTASVAAQRALGAKLSASLLRYLFVMAAASCSSTLPLARGGGAIFSDEGVLFAIDGQRCKQMPDSSQPGKTLVDATLALEVGNPTNLSVTFEPAGFVLMVSDRASVPKTAGDESTEPMSVPAGSSSRFELRFLASGTCTQEMVLEPKSAIKLSGRPVQIKAIRFVPVASP
jgi:hypothetical protein